jgi:hypothetical protein
VGCPAAGDFGDVGGEGGVGTTVEEDVAVEVPWGAAGAGDGPPGEVGNTVTGVGSIPNVPCMVGPVGGSCG